MCEGLSKSLLPTEGRVETCTGTLHLADHQYAQWLTSCIVSLMWLEVFQWDLCHPENLICPCAAGFSLIPNMRILSFFIVVLPSLFAHSAVKMSAVSVYSTRLLRLIAALKTLQRSIFRSIWKQLNVKLSLDWSSLERENNAAQLQESQQSSISCSLWDLDCLVFRTFREQRRWQFTTCKLLCVYSLYRGDHKDQNTGFSVTWWRLETGGSWLGFAFYEDMSAHLIMLSLWLQVWSLCCILFNLRLIFQWFGPKRMNSGR